MERSALIKSTLDRHALSETDRDWAEQIAGISLSDLGEKRGDFVDFTGRAKVLVAVIDAREALARAGL